MSNGKNRVLQRIAYACGTFGHDVFYAMIGTYFMIFVTSNLFKSEDPTNDAYMIGIVTTIILVLRIAELFVDPFIGNIIDKTKTRWGSYRSCYLGYAVYRFWRLNRKQSNSVSCYLCYCIFHHGYFLLRQGCSYLVHDSGFVL